MMTPFFEITGVLLSAFRRFPGLLSGSAALLLLLVLIVWRTFVLIGRSQLGELFDNGHIPPLALRVVHLG